jgi:hypothetical protein
MNHAMQTVPHLGPRRMDKLALLTFAALMRRGWSRTMVKTFLGLPDFQKKNFNHVGGANVLLYLVSRVEQVERMPEFLHAVHAVALREDQRRLADHISESRRERAGRDTGRTG